MTISQSKLNLVEFKDVKEPWNEYKLEDGSTLRVKIILKNLIKEAEGSYKLGTSNVISVWKPNPDFMGLPSPPLKEGENMESYIEAEDLQILSQTEHWNEYEVPSENMILKLRGAVVTVSRTNRHDAEGFPIYIANIQLLIKTQKTKGIS